LRIGIIDTENLYFKIDCGCLAKPGLRLGTELPNPAADQNEAAYLTACTFSDYSRAAWKDDAKANQLQPARIDAPADAMAGGCCQHERMMLYDYDDELLQDFMEFTTRLQKAKSGATDGGDFEKAGGAVGQKVMGRLVRRANEYIQV
jgi:hypothetical protein